MIFIQHIFDYHLDNLTDFSFEELSKENFHKYFVDQFFQKLSIFLFSFVLIFVSSFYEQLNTLALVRIFCTAVPMAAIFYIFLKTFYFKTLVKISNQYIKNEIKLKGCNK